MKAMNTTNATINNANNISKNDIREMLEEAGVTMSDSAFKRTKKSDLLAQLEQYLVEEPDADTVIASDEEMAEDFRKDMIDAAIAVGDLNITKDNAPAEEPVEKGGDDMDDMKVRNRRLLLNLLCYRWVAENRLFYKSNKYKKGGEFCYIASRKRQLGVTCKALKDLGWQANPVTLDRVAEILREEGLVVSATRDVYIPSAIWQKFVNGKQLLDRKKGDKDIVTYLKEVI